MAEPWGVWAATLTPIDRHLRIDAPRAIEYYAELLEAGCDGVNILGTTGEAMSFGVDQRIEFMESVAGTLPRERVMAGTGAASLSDTIRLTRCAIDAGLRAALILPPFFFRDATHDGVLRYYDEVLRAVPQSHGRLLLYNFPKMSGITFTSALVRRLVTELPGAFAGLKDSSNDRELQYRLDRRVSRPPRVSRIRGIFGRCRRSRSSGLHFRYGSPMARACATRAASRSRICRYVGQSARLLHRFAAHSGDATCSVNVAP